MHSVHLSCTFCVTETVEYTLKIIKNNTSLISISTLKFYKKIFTCNYDCHKGTDKYKQKVRLLKYALHIPRKNKNKDYFKYKIFKIQCGYFLSEKTFGWVNYSFLKNYSYLTREILIFKPHTYT